MVCPHCGQAYPMPPGQWPQYHGRTIGCPRCGHKFVAIGPQSAMPTLPPAAPVFTYPFGPSPPTSGWAITSLICGLLGCVPLVASVLAVVAGVLGLRQTRGGKAAGRGMAVTGLALGILGIALVLPVEAQIFTARLERGRESASQALCASRLQRLGQALQQYAPAHGNRFPDRLEALVAAGAVPADALLCPAGRDSSAPYLYAASGMSANNDKDLVLVYEPLSNHDRKGMHVLFADGRIQFISRAKAQVILDQQVKGERPIAFPPREGHR